MNPATTAVPRFGSVVLDCPDPRALADFYARLLDWPPTKAGNDDGAADDGDGWATIEGPGGAMIEFQRAGDYRRPTWPDSEVPQMFHLDLQVDDLEAAHERALEIGAKLLDRQRSFRVYADPAGHPFCLCQT
ncbi:VOC family protein [Actinophytocola sp.]|uniref:VOC family protein n=1 Tax=Actinophytocola sp. TaxID=1872138 RepID=UPI003D6B0D19